jgi:hypothetical protein
MDLAIPGILECHLDLESLVHLEVLAIPVLLVNLVLPGILECLVHPGILENLGNLGNPVDPVVLQKALPDLPIPAILEDRNYLGILKQLLT